MSDLHAAFISKSFLRSHWNLEYRAWHDSENEKTLDDRLTLRDKRRDSKETSAESAFIDARHGGMSRPASGVSRLGSLHIRSSLSPVQVQTAAVANSASALRG